MLLKAYLSLAHRDEYSEVFFTRNYVIHPQWFSTVLFQFPSQNSNTTIKLANNIFCSLTCVQSIKFVSFWSKSISFLQYHWITGSSNWNCILLFILKQLHRFSKLKLTTIIKASTYTNIHLFRHTYIQGDGIIRLTPWQNWVVCRIHDLWLPTAFTRVRARLHSCLSMHKCVGFGYSGVLLDRVGWNKVGYSAHPDVWMSCTW